MGVPLAASLCFMLFSLAGAMQVSIPQAEYEYTRGDNITLPCNFVPKKSPNILVIITWAVDGGDPTQPETMVLTHYSTGQTEISPLYDGRATLDEDIRKGKADLKLSGITLQDNEVFSCRVQIPGDDEGKLSDSVRLVVLERPDQSSDASATTPVPRTHKRPRCRESEIERRLSEAFARLPPPAEAPPSEDELFLRSLVPSLGRLSPQQRADLKFQIHKLIYEARPVELNLETLD